MTAVLDKKALMRDKRAQGIAAMGLVNREGDRFRVTTPTLRGRRASYEVWRDEAGRVRCTCLEFEEQSGSDPRYRCEHILAVKHAVLAKNTEAAAKQQQVSAPQAQGATPENVVEAETPSTLTQTASEKLGEAAAEATLRAPRKAPRFVREQNEQPEARKATEVEIIVAAETPQRSLAEHEETEELEMTKKATAHVQKAEEEQDFITAEEYEQQTAAPVVPLSFAKTLGTLKQPVDPRLIKTREGWRDRNGNQHMVEYVEWHTVADILDRVAPTWSHAVRGIVQIGEMVAVTCAITIDGVTREGVGTGNADNETGIKKAEHDALKRAAIKFGIARELYQRESEVIEREGAGPQPGEFPKDPLAKSMADLVTPKQLGMIRALAREAGVDPDEESQQVMRVRTEELSKRAASSFIDHLKGLQREQTFEVRRAS
ncbi:MAG TPA: Rad52/Rad22 family DNA repair protein [Pyrinomonadaceae bacterium]|nr:Rad52/Rad22 family DNA repair protein [Pyrinomonadaceae bacterium]